MVLFYHDINFAILHLSFLIINPAKIPNVHFYWGYERSKDKYFVLTIYSIQANWTKLHPQ